MSSSELRPIRVLATRLTRNIAELGKLLDNNNALFLLIMGSEIPSEHDENAHIANASSALKSMHVNLTADVSKLCQAAVAVDQYVLMHTEILKQRMREGALTHEKKRKHEDTSEEGDGESDVRELNPFSGQQIILN